MSHLQKLSNGKWKARWNDPATGADRAKTFPTKKMAENHLKVVDHEILTGGYIAPDRGRITVGEYAAKWLQRQRYDEAQRRIADNAIRVHIDPAIGRVRLDRLDRSRVQGLVDDLSSSMKASSVGNVLDVLKRILRDAVGEGLISRSPIPARGEGTPVRVPSDEYKAIRALTSDEVDLIVKASDEALTPLVVLLSQTGLRIGEALGLQVGSIDPAKSQLTVSRQRRQDRTISATKNKRARVVPLTRTTMVALTPLLVGRATNEDLWVTAFDEPLSYRAFRVAWDKAVEASGLDWKPSAHDLRHYYASALLRNGVDIVRVSAFLGHATVTKTLNVYAHLIDVDHSDVAAIFDGEDA